MKKEDKLWISILLIMDVLLWLGFFGIYLEIWAVDSLDNFTFGRLNLLGFFVMILNMAGIYSLLFYEHSDGSPVLPISSKAVLAIFGAGLVVIFIFERRLPSQADALPWVWLLPTMLFSVYFVLLLLAGLYKLSKR